MSDLPGMWEEADFIGGRSDSDEIARLHELLDDALADVERLAETQKRDRAWAEGQRLRRHQSMYLGPVDAERIARDIAADEAPWEGTTDGIE